MVHGRRPQLHGQGHTLTGADLVAVHPQPEPRVPAGLEHAARLLRIERPALAEHVRPLHVRGHGLEHGPAHRLHVLVRVHALGHQVGTQERDLVRGVRGDLRRAQLLLHVQAVARLRLQVGGATGHGIPHAPGHEPAQGFVAGFPGGVRGHADATRRVCLAGHTRGELLPAVPGEHQVRVRVHPAGQPRAPLHVHGAVRRGRLGGAAHPCDQPVLDDDGRVPEHGVLTSRGVHRVQLADAGDELGPAGGRRRPVRPRARLGCVAGRPRCRPRGGGTRVRIGAEPACGVVVPGGGGGAPGHWSAWRVAARSLCMGMLTPRSSATWMARS